MNWLEPPFNMMISGITNCGKTHYVLDLLETRYKNKFDYIVIYCPTFLVNKTYDRKFIAHENVIIMNVIDNLEFLLIMNTIYFGQMNKSVLFLIDDCANLRDSKIKSSELTKLAFSGRQYGISVWVITQKYNAMVKDFRDCIRMLILFYNKDKKSMELALEENDIIPKNKHGETIELLKKQKKKLVIRLEYPFEYTIE